MPEVLAAFLPAVQAWFREAFGQPTAPQSLGWPAIQRGEHTLILSPTGSGKTLAAFLWGIDELYREIQAEGPKAEKGVRLLYVSPLKALNNDVERNLRTPLAGIRQVAEALGEPLPRLEVLVRTGDTPQSDRRRMVKHPPHILITTPESLYLILTSPVARDMFRTLRTIIVDEIHTLVGNKRGAHLALSLERAVELASGGPKPEAGEPPRPGMSVQRIGLSATQKPLDEVARFLGGYQYPSTQSADLPGAGRVVDWENEKLVERPVTIIDAGMTKPIDLKVVTPVEDFRDLPGGSIWPAVIPRVMDLVEAHRTTLIFANSRRQAERTADRLNDLWLARQAGTGQGAEALTEGGAAKGVGFAGTGAVGGPFRAHHGSVSRDARLHLEQALKEGRLPALVGTSSLELGIDIGSIDLVVQLQSAKGVARSLQRVGRSGHLVGQTSVGRFFPTHREDLLESAAIAHAMRRGDVEPSSTPQNSLDVLAQQIVAMVSVQDWDVDALFRLIRRAYPYHRLTPPLYHSVLDMLSGRYPSSAFRELRPRIAWDRVHNRLAALPGSRLLAIRNGGTIPDRGTFGAYLPDRKTKLGELDEEFVFETRPGDVFTLGANTWRVQEVTEDRIVVTPAPGHLPRMPFWRGDAPRRDYHLGCLYGRFRRELAERLANDDEAQVIDWLQGEYCLDLNSARSAIGYVRRQVEVLGAISSDRTIVAELFVDPLGDLRLVIHSPLGARVNSPWALALASAFRQAMAPRPGLQGPQPEVMVSDDGILFRFLDADQPPPLALIREMGPAEARERLLTELPHSALFGAQFRVNAARALLLPAARGRQKRTPFWLQRLRAKDLLAVARDFEDFPIVAETYRDCLRDVLDLAHLEEVLGAIQAGEIEVITVETVVPSPVAASLLHDLIAQYMYEGDQPKAERQMQALMVGRDMLAQLLDEAALPDLLRPEAVREVADYLQHRADGSRARSADELATLFLALGDLTAGEAAARADGPVHDWLQDLVAQGRLVAIDLAGETRYVLSEHLLAYQQAFDPAGGPTVAPKHTVAEARRAILRRVLSTHGPLSRDWLLARYPWEPDWLDQALATLVDEGSLVHGQITTHTPDLATAQPTEPATTQYCDRRNLERIHRRTLALLRKEVEPVSLYAYADFLARWQHLHPAHRLSGPGALVRLLQQMRGVPAPGAIWERDLLPQRLEAYDPTELEALCAQGEVVWVASGGVDPRRARVRFFFRGEGGLFLPQVQGEETLSAAAEGLSSAGENLSAGAAQVLEFLKAEGASFFADLQAGLEGTQTGAARAAATEALMAALVELVLAGLVTNDSLHTLRQVLSWSLDAEGSGRQPLSALEAELAAWRRSRQVSPPAAGEGRERPVGWIRRPDRARLHRAQRDVARRLTAAPASARPDAGAFSQAGAWPGRWSLVHRIGVWGRAVSAEERIARQARQLLQCYGIVTRQSLEADPEGAWEWGALYRQFQLMEMRGEVRRGYFVQGLPGVQFALPEAVERLREWTQPQAHGTDELVLVNATDPANLFGPAPDGAPGLDEPAEPDGALPRSVPEASVPGAGVPDVGVQDPGVPDPGSDPARFVRIPANYLVLLRGRPVLLLEAGGARLASLPDLPPETAKRALRLAIERAAERRRLTVAEWNGQPVLDSPLAPLLEEVGFRREMLVYVWD